MRSFVATLALGAILFVGSCSLPVVGLWDSRKVGDIREYHRVGELIRHNEVPYRDFYLEYPPGALPVFVAPTLAGAGYNQAFRLLAAGLGAVTLGVVLVTLRLLGAQSRRLLTAAVAGGLAPLALGPVYVFNFDVWPALLTALALAALVGRRDRLGCGLLGLAFATKVYAAVLLPIALIRAWRERGLRAAALDFGVFGGVAAIVILPFAALAPGGVRFSLYVQVIKRPLQIESLGASFLLMAHQLGLYGGRVNSDYNSQNLSGSLARGIAVVSGLLVIAALLFAWTRYARGRLDFVVAGAFAVVAFVGLGKVQSPQYLIWLVPLVLLVDRGLPAMLLAGALVLTHIWFPSRYHEVVHFGAVGWLVFARDLILVAVLAALVRQARARAYAHAGERDRAEPPPHSTRG